MIKDYLPVSENGSYLSETAFIKDFWSQKWDQRALPTELVQRIEHREEFKLMQPFLANLPPGSRLLDGGCGQGEWTLYFAERGYQVTGLDLSQSTIQKLNARFPDHDFTTGDIRQIDFGESSLDAYFSWGVFEHFEAGLGAPLAEARRIIKPEGYLFISVPFQNVRHTRHRQQPLWNWDENFDPQNGYAANLRFYQWRLTQSELMRELEMNGFKTIQIAPIHKRVGLRRMVQLDLHIDPHSIPGKAAQVLIYPLLPKTYVAHMLFAASQKR
jgi:ubiquinone/menaquinone biosynthesis C-methylase UbiE